MSIPDPALVVLVGASGSGKSTWAAQHYRAEEVVSSDALRGVVGSGPHDLDASDDAFAVLESVVSARLGRRLTTVVDTLGFDVARRRGWLSQARDAGMPAVVVVLETPDEECRRRNAQRDRPVPARALAGQLRRARAVAAEVAARDGTSSSRSRAAPTRRLRRRPPRRGASGRGADGIHRGGGAAPGVAVPVGGGPAGLAARRRARRRRGRVRRAGADGPRRPDPPGGRAWDPIPEPWVTLGAVAALGTGLRLGTLCTPVTFRPPGITAKAAATLSALTGGRAFVGIGAGWWEREHAAHGLPFPPAARAAGRRRARHPRHEGAVGAGHEDLRGCRGLPSRDHLLPAPAAPSR